MYMCQPISDDLIENDIDSLLNNEPKSDSNSVPSSEKIALQVTTPLDMFELAVAEIFL